MATDTGIERPATARQSLAVSRGQPSFPNRQGDPLARKEPTGCFDAIATPVTGQSLESSPTWTGRSVFWLSLSREATRTVPEEAL
jgi:hypothetical protein